MQSNRSGPKSELRPEYRLDYSKAVRGKYFRRLVGERTNVVVLEPVAVDRTRTVTYALTNGGGDDPDALAQAKRDADFVGNTGAAEDRAVVQAIQQGLASGANEAFTFGRFEKAIVHFHRTLDAALGA